MMCNEGLRHAIYDGIFVRLVGWCSTALSAQKGYIMPYEN